jgi:hypothetical protein
MKDYENELSIVREALAKSMESFIGEKLTSAALVDIEHVILMQLHDLISRGIVSNPKLPVVRVKSNNVDRSVSVKFFDSDTNEEISLQDLLLEEKIGT